MIPYVHDYRTGLLMYNPLNTVSYDMIQMILYDIYNMYSTKYSTVALQYHIELIIDFFITVFIPVVLTVGTVQYRY